MWCITIVGVGEGDGVLAPFKLHLKGCVPEDIAEVK